MNRTAVPRVAIATILALTAGLFAATPAAAVGTASISGTVYGAEAPTVGLGSVTVAAVLEGSNGAEAAFVGSEPDGSFLIEGLAPGSYTLRFDPYTSNPAHARAFWGGGTYFSAAEFFDVADGAAVTGKDIALAPVSTISGHVTGSDEAALAGVNVYLYGLDNSFSAVESTDVDGNFAITTAPSGTYTLSYSLSGYPMLFWGAKTVWEQADSFTVVGGTAVTGRDMVMPLAGAISGQVQLDNGSTTAGAQAIVVLSFAEGNSYGDEGTVARQLYTDPDGIYSLEGLAPGGYSLESLATGYVTSTVAITVVAGVTASDTDAVLVLPSHIAGTLRDNNGAMVGNVYLYSAGAAGDYADNYLGYTTTDGDGVYRFDELPVGDYVLGFGTYSSSGSFSGALPVSSNGFVSQWYSQKYSYASADVLHVTTAGTAIDQQDVVLQNPTFADASDPSNVFYPFVEWMNHEQLSTGTPQTDGKPLYRPLDAVSRQAMAAFMFRNADPGFIAPTEPSFADVPTSSAFYTEIEWMAASGIATGTPQAEGLPLFMPTAPVSRSAAAYFFARYSGHADYSAPDAATFADVPIDSAAAGVIEWMHDRNVANGTPQPSGLALYKPSDPVSRQAVAAFLYRLRQVNS